MNWISRIFVRLAGYFRSGKAARDAQLALEYVARALPYVKIAADLVISLTPTQVDDLAWAAIKTRYPSLFDGKTKTQDEVKAAAMLIASDLLKAKYPELSTSVARAAVQLAYIDQKNAA